MANRTFATIKIATKEEVDNAFIVNFFKKYGLYQNFSY